MARRSWLTFYFKLYFWEYRKPPLAQKNKKIKHLTHFYKKTVRKTERERKREREEATSRERKTDNRINFQKTIGCESIGIKHNR